MQLRRHRFKQTQTLKERLLDRSVVLREQAQTTINNDARVELLKRAAACDVAAHMEGWLHSKELVPPH